MKHVFIFVANYRKNLHQYDECRAFCSSTTSFGLYCEQCGKVQEKVLKVVWKLIAQLLFICLFGVCTLASFLWYPLPWLAFHS